MRLLVTKMADRARGKKKHFFDAEDDGPGKVITDALKDFYATWKSPFAQPSFQSISLFFLVC